ncbi:uncharacterized protein YciI [Prauserella shujinwangii]|uniref:Uncharacterized protein YciI n=1 Tax=Prauserella shujinwangii TaxID=1453103 RepID=A0A2T0M0L2_9PSEU|nr:hypothetical protein [Prauserella shujinwangii]PRX50121.1 uncharacterized protein YciI [Prauserella shujinwangii]
MIHILRVEYRAPRVVLEDRLADHREWLRKNFDNGNFLVAGPTRDGQGAVIVTADLAEETIGELISADPWQAAGLVDYQTTAFAAAHISPGVVTCGNAPDPVLLINVATTQDAPRTLSFLGDAVQYVAETADGFRGSRLLASVEQDTVVNFAAWDSEKQFAAIFEDEEFVRRYREFAQTTDSARYRLYRTKKIFSPRR